MASSAERFRLVEGTIPVSGDISNTLTNTNNTSAGRGVLKAQFADNLESVGVTNKNSSNFLGPITNSIINQTPIHKQSSATPLDLSSPSVRLPGIFSPDEIMRRAQEAIDGTPSIAFPNDLTEQAIAYVKLDFKPYSRTAAFSRGSLGGSKSILLPLPENYNQTFTVNYSEKDQGFFGDVAQSNLGRDVLQQFETSQNSLRDRVRNTVDVMRGRSSEAQQLAGELSTRAGYSMLDGFSDVIGGIAQQTVGFVPNPHTSIFFKGPGLRQFTWTWRLVPRSANEATIIREILKRLRESVLPKKDGNLLKYPDLMQPTVKGQVDLGKFKRCLVGGMTVNYSAEGTSAFFKDGHPSAISLTLNFQEVEVLTAEDQGN